MTDFMMSVKATVTCLEPTMALRIRVFVGMEQLEQLWVDKRTGVQEWHAVERIPLL